MRTLFLLPLLSGCVGGLYEVPAPDGGKQPVLTFSPACGSPGDTVVLTAIGACLAPVGRDVTADMTFAGQVPSAKATVVRNDRPNEVCQVHAVVPEAATTGILTLNGVVDAKGPWVASVAEFLVHSDPALDIASSQSFVDMGRPWIRVIFAGAWPRPAYYSHYVKIILRRLAMTAATHTDQLHSGVASTMTTGIDPSKSRLVEEPNGFRILFDDPTLVIDGYSIECGVLKTMGGTFVQDTSGPFGFERTEKAFGAP